MAWLEKTSGQAFDPQRTIIVAQYSKEEPAPLAFLGVDHQVVRTQPDNGERLFHKREGGSVAFVPSVAGLIIAGEVIKDLTAEYRR